MILLKLLVVFAGCLASALANHPFDFRSVDSDIFNRADVNYRLPNYTHPETYDISLFTRVDRNDFEFSGVVKIGIVVDQTTQEIVLHARQLTISRITLLRYSGNTAFPVNTLPHTYDVVPEFLKIKTNGENLLPGDRLELVIAYNGTLRNDEMGFYRSFYTNENGNKT